MRYLRLLILALAAICVLALAAFALVNSPVEPGDDEIIIKGGSLDVDCGKNHGNDCFGDSTTAAKKPKHKQTTKKITKIVVRPVNGNDNEAFFRSEFDPKKQQPEIVITYK